MEADAILLGAPCMTRAIPWEIKRFTDTTLGPFQDVTMARHLQETGQGHLVDLRIFKPRALAILTLGGARATEWAPFTLPLLHQVFFPLGVMIVDQMQVFGTGLPDSFLCRGEAVEWAKELGRNLAVQAAGERLYVGPEGMCPICHLGLFNFVPRGGVDCATCGMKGRMQERHGEMVFVTDAEGMTFSILMREGMERHLAELESIPAVEQGAGLMQVKEELATLRETWMIGVIE